jgi:hypothetical protein
MLPARRQLHDQDTTHRRRVESGVDLCAPELRSALDRGDEPSASDVERQRAYADWLSRFEPAQQRGRDGIRAA